MSDFLHRFEIPIPPDPELLKDYLALGWYELPDPPRLKWSFACGSPRHPGEPVMPPDSVEAATLRMLDVPLLNELERYLPFAWNFEGDSIKARALLTVTFLKVKRRERHKGRPALAMWQPDGAELTVLPSDIEPPIPNKPGGFCND